MSWWRRRIVSRTHYSNRPQLSYGPNLARYFGLLSPAWSVQSQLYVRKKAANTRSCCRQLENAEHIGTNAPATPSSPTQLFHR